jgi:hypothetical protein
MKRNEIDRLFYKKIIFIRKHDRTRDEKFRAFQSTTFSNDVNFLKTID